VRAVFSLLFWIFLITSSAVLFLLALVIFVLTLPFDRNGRVLHIYTCWWARSYLRINPFWKVTVEGAKKIDRNTPYVIAANHQSFADILALSASYLPFKWVSKASVFKVPFIGWNAALNQYVSLVRGDRASIEKMAAQCRSWLSRGVSVAIFPEGTRSKDGQLQAFKLGAFRIARDAKVKVLPAVIDGTAEALPKHGMVLRASAHCRVHVLDPIDISGYATDEEAAKAVREVMAAELARMRS
jgi:1-acyl-sn-glycerol-3-phosphate acyltransferase